MASTPSGMNLNQLQGHIQTIHDECKRLVKRQPVKNEEALMTSLLTLTSSLKTVTEFHRAGLREQVFDKYIDPLDVLEASLKGTFYEPMLNEASSFEILRQVYKICKVRNRFFYLFNKLKQIDVDHPIFFEKFIEAHKEAMVQLSRHHKIDMEQVHWSCRYLVREIENIAYRTE